MKVRVTKVGVTEGRSIVPVDTEIDLDAKSAQALIDGDYAVTVEVEDDPGNGGGVGGNTEQPTPEAMTKALDKAYKADELKTAAKAAGVEFADDANKGAVIAAVIEAGKYADLVKQ